MGHSVSSLGSTGGRSWTEPRELSSAGTAAAATAFGLRGIQAVLESVSSVPYAGVAIEAALAVINAIEATRRNKKDLKELAEHVKRLVFDIQDGVHKRWSGGKVPQDMEGYLEDLTQTFKELEAFVKRRNAKIYIEQVFLNARDKEKTAEFDRRLTNALRRMLVNMDLNVREILGSVNEVRDHLKISTIMAEAGTSIIEQLPPVPEHFFGRHSELEALVTGVIGKDTARICILGPGGIGKSTLARKVMHDSRVREKFGPDRYFVRLDTAKNAQETLLVFARTLRVEVQIREDVQSSYEPLCDQIMDQVLEHLQNQERTFLIVFDNLETPWEADAVALERLLSQWSALSSVTIIATLRGRERPRGVSWTRIGLQPLMPLSDLAAAQLFDVVSDRTETVWTALLRELDNVPLAIVLLATLAQTGEQPEALSRRWNKERSNMLERLDQKSSLTRETSVTVSIALSINSPLLAEEEDAKRLLCLLSLMPEGHPREDLSVMLRTSGLNVDRSVSILLRMTLAYETLVSEDRDAIIRVLAPIRGFMRTNYPCDAGLKTTATLHCFSAWKAWVLEDCPLHVLAKNPSLEHRWWMDEGFEKTYCANGGDVRELRRLIAKQEAKLLAY